MRVWCSPARRLALTSRRENGRPWASSRAFARSTASSSRQRVSWSSASVSDPSFCTTCLENLDHGVQVLERVERKPVVAVIHEALRTAAILGRTGAVTPGANGIGLPSLRLQPVFDANLVAPGDVQVVLIDKPRTFAEAQRRQGHVRRGRRQLPRAVTRGTQLENIEVDAFPAHGHLDHAVEFAKRERSPAPERAAIPSD